MRPFSQKQPFGERDVAIQGDSVRQTWGVDGPSEKPEWKPPLRREAPVLRVVPDQTDDTLRIRLGEELDHVRRMLDVTGDELANDPVAVPRHTVALQYLDKVGQMLGHIANLVRSTDPQSTIADIGMGDLKARLTRSGAL